MQQAEPKTESPALAPQNNKIELKLQPAKTKDDGNCAIHACLGNKNASGVYECKEAQAYRTGMRQALKENKDDLILRELAISGIKELMMSGRSIGAASKNWLKHYQEFLDEQYISSTALWEIFENVLREDRHKNALDYIQENHEHPLGDAAKLRDKFFDALNRNDSELYGIILSLPALDTAFKLYNELSQTKFDWEAMPKAVIDEYADFIGTPKQWLLPSDIAVLARTAGITVIYYTYAGAEPLIFNPGQPKEVPIQFDGRGHFERLVPVPISSAPEPKKEKKEIDTSHSAPKTSESKKEQKEEEENTEEPDLPFDLASIPSAETINNKDAQGMAAIHHAASTGNSKALEALLAKGADINLLTSHGLTTLQLATQNKRRECVRILLENHADPTPVDSNGKNFLHYLATATNSEINFAKQLALLSQEQRTQLSAIKDHQGQTALHHAAAKGNYAVFKPLIDLGIDIDAQDHLGYTALHRAAQYEDDKHVKSVEELLRLNANPYLLRHDGLAVMHQAELFEQWSIVDVLMAHRRKQFPFLENPEILQAWKRLEAEYRAPFDIAQREKTERETDETKKIGFHNTWCGKKIKNALEDYVQFIPAHSPLLTEALILQSNAHLLLADSYAERSRAFQKDIPGYCTEYLKTIIGQYELSMAIASAALNQANLYAKKSPNQFKNAIQLIHMQMQRIIYRYLRTVCELPAQPIKFTPYLERRQALTDHRAHLRGKLEEKSLDIEKMSVENTQFFIKLSAQLWLDAQELMPQKPTCQYALICMGSMAHQEMGPYSDLEFAVLIPPEKNQNSGLAWKKKMFFQQTAGLMYLLVTALGEEPVDTVTLADGLKYQPTPVGFHFDIGGGITRPNNPALNPIYIATPKELLALQNSDNGPNSITRLILLATGFLVGDQRLYEEYQQGLHAYLNEDLSPWHKRVFRSVRETHGVIHGICCMREATDDYGPTKQNNNTLKNSDHFIDIKARLYRMIGKTLSGLSYFYGIKEPSNFKRITILEAAGHISPELAQALRNALRRIITLRYVAQLHYECQKENIYIQGSALPVTQPYEKPPLLIKNKLWEDLLEVFELLSPLEAGLRAFKENNGNPNPFATFKVEKTHKLVKDESKGQSAEACHLKAQAYEVAQNPEKAEHWYKQAIVLDPHNPLIRVQYLSFLQKNYAYHEQNYQSGRDQGLRWIKQFIQLCVKSKIPAKDYRFYKNILFADNREWQEAFQKEIQLQTSGDYLKSILEALTETSPEKAGVETKREAKKAPLRLPELSKNQMQLLEKARKKILQQRNTSQPLASILQIPTDEAEELAAYQSVLWEAELTAEERISFIAYTLALLRTVQAQRQIQKDNALKERDYALCKYIDYLLSQGAPIEDFVSVFKRLPSELQQEFLFVVQARWESSLPPATSAPKEEKTSRTPKKTAYSEDFLEHLLKELNNVSQKKESEHSIQARKVWRVTLSAMVDSHPMDAQNSSVQVSSPLITPEIESIGQRAKMVTSLPLRRELREALYDEKLIFKFQNISGSVRRVIATTVQTPYGAKDLHFKAMPEMPGMSRFVELMHQHFFGHGTSMSELVAMQTSGQQPLPVLVSETVPGENMEEVLNHHKGKESKDGANPLDNLAHQHFSELALMAMFINPEDGIPSNYIVRPIMVDGRQMFTLVCVDNDHALFDAYSPPSAPEGLKLQVKTILFCLDQMLLPIDPQARENFCKMNIIETLRSVLHDAQIQNTYYELLFAPDTMQKLHRKKDAKEASTIPIPLKKGIIVKIYQKMLRMQRFLSNPANHNKSLLECLIYIEPRVGAAYQKALFQHLSPMERLKTVGEYPAHTRIVSINPARTSLHYHTAAGVAGYEKLEDLSPAQSLAELNLMEYQYRYITNFQAEILRGDFRGFKTLKAVEHKAIVIGGEPQRKIPALRWNTMAISVSEGMAASPFISSAAEQKSECLRTAQIELMNLLGDLPFVDLNLAHCAVLTSQHLDKLVRSSPDLHTFDLSHHATFRRQDLLPLNNNASLQVLVLQNIQILESLHEFRFPNLDTLSIINCQVLTKICIIAPKLKHLRIINCPRLVKVQTDSMELEEVELSGARVLPWQGLIHLNYWVKVSNFSIRDCDTLEATALLKKMFSQFPFLVELHKEFSLEQIQILYSVLESNKQHATTALTLSQKQRIIQGLKIFANKRRIINTLIQGCRRDTRSQAFLALGECGKLYPELGRLSLKTLIPSIQKPPFKGGNIPGSQKTLIQTIASIGKAHSELGKEALDALKQCISNSEFDELVINEIGNLGWEHDHLSDQVLSILEPLLSPSFNRKTRFAAIKAMAHACRKKSAEKVFRLIIPFLSDDGFDNTSINAITGIALFVPELAELAFNNIAKVLLTTKQEYRKAEAITQIGKLGAKYPALAQYAFNYLLPIYKKGSQYDREGNAAALALGELALANKGLTSSICEVFKKYHKPKNAILAIAKIARKYPQHTGTVFEMIKKNYAGLWEPDKQAFLEIQEKADDGTAMQIVKLVSNHQNKNNSECTTDVRVLGAIMQSHPALYQEVYQVLWSWRHRSGFLEAIAWGHAGVINSSMAMSVFETFRPLFLENNQKWHNERGEYLLPICRTYKELTPHILRSILPLMQQKEPSILISFLEIFKEIAKHHYGEEIFATLLYLTVNNKGNLQIRAAEQLFILGTKANVWRFDDLESFASYLTMEFSSHAPQTMLVLTEKPFFENTEKELTTKKPTETKTEVSGHIAPMAKPQEGKQENFSLFFSATSGDATSTPLQIADTPYFLKEKEPPSRGWPTPDYSPPPSTTCTIS